MHADLVCATFGGTRRQALRSYLGLVKRGRSEPWLGRLERLPWWRAEPVDREIGRGPDALGATAGPAQRRLPAAELLARVAPLVRVEVRELAGAQRGAAVLAAHELAAGVAVERRGVGVKELTDALGKSRDGVSRWVRRAARRRPEEPAFARRLNDLDRKLARSMDR